MGRCETIAGGPKGTVPVSSDETRDSPRERLHRLARWAAILLAAALAGCSGLRQWWDNGFKVGPDYTPPAVQVAEGWREAGDPQLTARAAGDGCWWTVFGDPALNRLIESACRQNLSLRGAGFLILESRAQRGIAASNLFPQKQEMISQYSRNRFSANAYPFGIFPIRKDYNDCSIGFDAAWEFDIWGRFRGAVEAADAALDAQVENYDDILVLLQAEVAANYIQLRTLQQRIALTRENLDLQRNTLRLVELRYGKGLIGELDVDRARAQAATTESLLPPLETALRQAENRLCVLMGRLPGDLAPMLAAGGPIPAAPPEVIVGIPAELLRRRPDVRRAERQAAAQSARIGMAQAEFYPHLALTGTITLEAQNLAQVFQGSSLAGTVGPGFRWNILNYGRIVNDVRAQDARFQQAVAQYQESVLKAHEETENAIVAFLRERERAESLRTAATATQQAVKLAVLQYDKGLVDYQPLLDTQRELVRQQDGVAESSGQVALDLVAVYKALAGGWQIRLAAGAGGLPEFAAPPGGKPAEPIPAPPPAPLP
ncbi:MAG: efflux transporter outer membrane subunit [Thermoguttaceae bacterium]